MIGKVVIAMMNIRSFKYHLKEGIKSLFKNRRMSIASIASVATCISMLITSLCIAINLDSTLENLEKNIGISVYLGEIVTTEQAKELFEELGSIENISNISYTTKEDALEWAKEQWGESSIILSGLDKDNPFPRSFEIEIDGTKNQDAVLESIQKVQKDFEIKLLTAMEIEQIELSISLGDADIYFDEANIEENTEEELSEEQEGVDIKTAIQEEIIKNVSSKINSPSYEYIGIEKISHSKKEADILLSLSTAVRIMSVILILIFAIISVIIIINTIKITVYVRREEINIMKYVGATNSFIRWPFIIEGILIGIIGAIIPSVACFLIYIEAVNLINYNLYLNAIISLKPALDLFLLIVPLSLILGILLGIIGSVNSIKKHLDV